MCVCVCLSSVALTSAPPFHGGPGSRPHPLKQPAAVRLERCAQGVTRAAAIFVCACVYWFAQRPRPCPSSPPPAPSQLDVAIDGADEVSSGLNCTKVRAWRALGVDVTGSASACSVLASLAANDAHAPRLTLASALNRRAAAAASCRRRLWRRRQPPLSSSPTTPRFLTSSVSAATAAPPCSVTLSLSHTHTHTHTLAHRSAALQASSSRASPSRSSPWPTSRSPSRCVRRRPPFGPEREPAAVHPRCSLPSHKD